MTDPKDLDRQTPDSVLQLRPERSGENTRNQPLFLKYLEQRRRALISELHEIDRLLGKDTEETRLRAEVQELKRRLKRRAE